MADDIRYLLPVDVNNRNSKKYFKFKKSGIKYIDYKDPDFLMRFVNEQGKILPRRVTGLTSKQQKKLNKLIKTARIAALLPFVIGKG